RTPAPLAAMARPVAHMSGGRLILGFGAGWFEKDYDQYGYEFGTPGTRIAERASPLPRVKARLGSGIPDPPRVHPVLV
ncbi:LLM class flavin-dependent oxidoreductase, partial [Cellulomonas sp. GbtcB1]|uniref:LLM class flavin-dependent oxidoreductase n=1 Tax=Cellulomonas sp. GbtcB1 TaxID=2824746 RepID=UPI001C2FEC8F